MTEQSSTSCCPPDGLTDDPSTWLHASLLSVTQITPGGLTLLFSTATSMRTLVAEAGGDSRLRHRVLATVFYEASTRTSCSFQAAAARLGGGVVHVDASSSSSASSSKKGETLEDTIRCLACYADVMVLRHPVTGSVGRVVENMRGRGISDKPILNAGDGVGEHPTQALLDLYTVVDELGEARCSGGGAGVTVVMLGDLRHGRTVHSLARLLCRCGIWKAVTLRYCAPSSELGMPDEVKDYVTRYGGEHVKQEEVNDLAEAVKDADVLYVTRVQKERFASEESYEAVKGAYVVNKEVMDAAPRNMVVMHPLPRVDEISTEIDDDPRSAYFRQMENGMYVRMALLALVLGKV